MRPLDGLRVVALEHAVAGPLCTRHLADLGADVVKIERPGSGDFARHYDTFVNGECSFFIWLNRGKRSLTLDVKAPDGRDVLHRLIRSADVLVQNLAPGAAARLGLSHTELVPEHPRLVVCDISGYGESGPFARKKAYDLLIQAESGVISVTGTPDAPSRVGISIADIATGMYAQTGVLAALLRRERTGQGANTKIAMLDALVEWMMPPLYRFGYDGTTTPRAPTSHPLLAPYGAHRTSDGQVIFGLQNEREWVTFCALVLGRPDLAIDPRFATNVTRCEHRVGLTALIEEHFANKTTREVVDLLDRAGIANGRLDTPGDVWAHPQLEARARWHEVGSPSGPVHALLPPMTFTDLEAAMGDVPALGQHTDEVLHELGYSATEVVRLRRDGVV